MPSAKASRLGHMCVDNRSVEKKHRTTVGTLQPLPAYRKYPPNRLYREADSCCATS